MLLPVCRLFLPLKRTTRKVKPREGAGLCRSCISLIQFENVLKIRETPQTTPTTSGTIALGSCVWVWIANETPA